MLSLVADIADFEQAAMAQLLVCREVIVISDWLLVVVLVRCLDRERSATEAATGLAELIHKRTRAERYRGLAGADASRIADLSERAANICGNVIDRDAERCQQRPIRGVIGVVKAISAPTSSKSSLAVPIQIVCKAGAGGVEQCSAGASREREAGVQRSSLSVVPGDAGPSGGVVGVQVIDDVLLDLFRFPHRQAIAMGIDPRAEMIEADTKGQRELLGSLPIICDVAVYRRVFHVAALELIHLRKAAATVQEVAYT